MTTIAEHTPEDIYPSYEALTDIYKQVLPTNPRVDSIWDRVVKNPFFWALVLTAGTITAIVCVGVLLFPWTALAVAAVALPVLAIGYRLQSQATKKRLFSEFSLARVIAYNFLGIRPWYSEINLKQSDGQREECVRLGAGPLRKDIPVLVQKGYDAVLSLLSEAEVEPHLFGLPAQRQDLEKEKVDFCCLPTEDLTPVSVKNIWRGIRFLNDCFANNQKVYVHCKSGIGRSATILICYLISEGMNPKAAADFVRAKRGIAVDENSPAIKAFCEDLYQTRP